jgi:putative ABC transport system permease protein
MLLAESLVIAFAGGVAGVGFAWAGGRLLSAFRPPIGVPVSLDLSMDPRIIGFTFAVAAFAGIAFGLAPALAASKTDVVGSLKSGGGASAGSRRRWVRGGLVVSQVAVSAVLLVGAGLLGRSLLNSRTIDPGFDASRVVVLSAAPELLHYDEASTRRLWDDVLARVRLLPGVRGSSLALWTALGDRSDAMQIAPRDGSGRAEQAALHPYNLITPGYFATLGIPLIAGRDFAPRDARGSADVAIINQAMARRFWPEDDAVGRRIAIHDRAGNVRDAEVIGVTATTRVRTLGEAPRPLVDLPYAQWYRPDMVLHVRTAGDPRALLEPVRAAFHSAEPDLPAKVSLMEDEMSFSLIPARLAAWVLGFAGGLGLLLAAMGVFGVVSQSVGRRLREMGIRMALGARRRDVRVLVLTYGLKLAAVGIAVGLALAMAGAQLLRGLLNGVGPIDPVTFGGIAVVLCGVALLACWPSARRATSVDPAVVLRAE